MPSDDREKQFERALAQHLRNASPNSACADAETLAAYHERTLSLKEMVSWKEHIVGCTRCQESLALVEKSEDVRAEEWEHQSMPVPVGEMASPKLMRVRSARIRQEEEVLKSTPMAAGAAAVGKGAARLHWRWVVPVGALAASVIVWIGVREIRTQHGQSMESVQVAQNQPAAPAAQAPSFEARESLNKEKSPARTLPEEAQLQNKVAAASPKIIPSQKIGAAEVASVPPPPASEPTTTNQKAFGVSGALKAPPEQPVPPVPGYAGKSRTKEMTAPTAADTTVSGGAGGDRSAEAKKQAPVPSMTETVEVTAAAPTVNTNSSTALPSNSTQLAVQARNVATFMQLAIVDRRFIVAPGEKNAWRVGEAGKIEHSTDRGKTWKPQRSGVTSDLTAGSATSDKVCWIAGKAGTLLLTTDGGKHWKTISSPITEDLGGIHATDALHASIWDVPNRKSFETNDGGATWDPISNK